MDYSDAAAFIGVGIPAATGAGRVSHVIQARLAQREGAVQALLNRATGRLEIGPMGAGPEGREAVAQGFRAAGKSIFTLSFQGRLPPFRKAFLESQNLACLRVPRAGIFAFDLFYLTHPDSWRDRLLGSVLYRGLGGYPFILTCSEYSRGEICSRFRVAPDRVRAVPLDCDRAVFAPRPADRAAWLAKHKLPPGRRVFAHLSSGDRRKNLPRILRAFRLVAEKQPDAIFVKAGKVLHGRNHQALLACLKGMGLKDKVFFLEGLSDADVAEMYNAADVFVSPSLAEGFGFPVLEAQACGCPVVTSKTTSLREVAGPLSLAVDPEDEIAIADAMDALLRDAGFRARQSEASRVFLERFSYAPLRAAIDEWFGEA